MEPIGLMNDTFFEMSHNYTTKNASKKTTIPILSIYGGGTRGTIPIKVLKEITKRTGLEPAEAFKMLSGTSIGGIAVGILNIKSKDDPTKPAVKIDEFDRCFEQDSRTIFPSYSGINPYRWAYPEYDRSGLHSVLCKYAGDALITDGIREIAIPAICDEFRSTWYFTRNKIVHLDPERKLYQHRKDDVMNGISLVDVMEATSAAPTYFKEKQMLIDGIPYNFRDGGLSVNNCDLSAYSFSYHANGASADYLVCTIGTGRPKTVSKGYFDNLSYAYWGRKYAEYSIEATQENSNVILKEFLPGEGEDQKLFILQTEIDEADNSVDDTSQAHFVRMNANVQAMMEHNNDELEILCKKLEAIHDIDTSV